jgi:flagellar biosynthesis chaperone FliJ
MAFHFPLEAILRLRRGQERAERLKLEAIASEQALARNRLENMTQQFFASRRRFQQQLGDEKFGAELQFEDARSDRVAGARRTLEMRVAELEQVRLKQVGVYKKAHQSREVLENLRGRKLALYLQMLSRREQQELDDLFLMRKERFRDE